MTPALSARQQQALHALEGYLQEHGYAPTVREFAGCLGVTVNAGAGLLQALEAKGAIRRWPGKARAIQVIGAEELGAEARARALQENADDARVDAMREGDS